jgi:hypothetical protein
VALTLSFSENVKLNTSITGNMGWPRKQEHPVLLLFGFDFGGLTEIRIGYTGSICNDFELLDS